MLFKILKLFGLDVPATIEAVKASLELRVEQAMDHVGQVSREAAAIAALSAAAGMTAAMAGGIALIALYRWTAEAYGAYAGLGVVGAILIVLTVIFATAAAIKGKSLAADRTKRPRYTTGPADVISDADAILGTEPASRAFSFVPPTAARPASPAASASDLAEPLAFLLSKVVTYPSIGNPLADEFIGSLRATARGTTDEALERAADVVRHGDRTNLLIVMGGAAFVGWLLSHHSRHS